MTIATFTLDELPEITFEVVRGSNGNPDQPSNWLTITATKPGVPTEENADPDPVVVCQTGFAGP